MAVDPFQPELLLGEGRTQICYKKEIRLEFASWLFWSLL